MKYILWIAFLGKSYFTLFGGDGQELGDAFDDAEQNREEPFRHGEEGVDEVME